MMFFDILITSFLVAIPYTVLVILSNPPHRETYFTNTTYVCESGNISLYQNNSFYSPQECRTKGPIRYIWVVALGRFGNNVIQLLNALKLAHSMNIKTLYIPESFWFINESIRINGYKFFKKIPKNFQNYIKHDFFHELIGDFCPERSFYSMLAAHIQSILPNVPNINNNTIILHVRSGDVFAKDPPAHYTQPPLCFYTGALKLAKVRKCIIFSENLNSPIIEPLMRLKCQFMNYSIKKAIAYMYYSRHIALSYGTFVHSLLKSCNISKTLYISELMVGAVFEENNNYFFKIYVNKLDRNYIRLMLPWKRTAIQIDYMMLSTCPIWYIRKRPIGHFSYPKLCFLEYKTYPKNVPYIWIS